MLAGSWEGSLSCSVVQRGGAGVKTSYLGDVMHRSLDGSHLQQLSFTPTAAKPSFLALRGAVVSPAGMWGLAGQQYLLQQTQRKKNINTFFKMSFI